MSDGPAVVRSMSDTSLPRAPVQVTECETDATLASASRLFDQYRRHYGQPPGAEERTLTWLTDMVRSGMLTVYTASDGSTADAPPHRPGDQPPRSGVADDGAVLATA